MFKQHVNTPRYAKDAATKLYVDELGVKLQTAIDDAIDTIPPPLDAYTKTEADIRYVNVAGDTMTGDLTINKADAQIHLKKTAGTGAYITTYNGSLPRWSLQLGNVTAESGANAGSDFALLRFSDAGALVDAPLVINRSTGLGTVAGNPTAPLGIATKGYVDTAVGVINPANFVLKAGDTMSGDLRINKTAPYLVLDKTTDAGAVIIGKRNGLNRWFINVGASDPETGGNAGSGFYLTRCNDDGSVGADVLFMDRVTGASRWAGDLTIRKSNPFVVLDKAASGQSNIVAGVKAGVTRWWLRVGNDEPESSGDAGSNFDILRWSDTGAYLGGSLNITRATGNVIINNNLSIQKELVVNGSCTVFGPGLSLSGPAGQSATFNMTKAVDGDVIQSYISTYAGSKWLWRWADAGSNDINLYRLNAAGSIVSTPISVVWSTGNINFNATVSVGNSLTVGGPITAYGGMWIHNNTDAGIVYLGNSGAVYLQNDGASLNLFGKPVIMNNALTISGILNANGKIAINNSTGLIANSAGSQALEVKSAGVGNSSFMAFHIPGSFASNFGIDTDTFWKVGGWSMGAVAHKVWHDGICPNSGTYFRMPSGLMYVMGTCPAGMGNGWVNFPVAFPTTVLGIAITGQAALADGSSITCNQQAFEHGRFYFQPRYVNSGGAVGVATQLYFYVAWGY